MDTHSLLKVRRLIGIFLVFFSSLALAAIPKAPQLKASSWILLDADSGHMITSFNEDKAVPPASLTKMMTAYVAEAEIAAGNLLLDEEAFISVKAWKTGGSRMFVREGTHVKVEDLLRGIIIQSGNDASVALAEHIAGSEGSFVDLMNQHARRLGMENTHFMNATGLPAENHYASAKDMAILAKAIIQDYPEQYSVYAEKYFTYNDIKQPNRNSLLWRDDAIDGLKTGHTDAAGYCLVASAKKDGMRLISAVMGTKSVKARAAESQKLLNYGFRFFETHKAYKKDSVLNSAQVWFGEKTQLAVGPLEDIVITIPRNSQDKVKAQLEIENDLKAPITKGQKVGVISISVDGKVIKSLPASALHEIKEAGFMTRIWHYIQRFFSELFAS